MAILRKGNLSVKAICLLLVFAVAFVYVIEYFKVFEPREEYDLQVQAATLMEECLKEIAQLRAELGIPFDYDADPNHTGIIGEEITVLSTTPGNEIAKRTSTNPSFAAMMVKFFLELGLESGDSVAIGSSGSFPSALLATLCAAKVLDLVPYTTYSFGASTHGATIPEMTFWHMLERLREKDLLPFEFVAVSMGGSGDQGKSQSFSTVLEILGYEGPSHQDVLRELCENTGLLFIDIPDMESNIRYRLDMYEELSKDNPIKCFVNVGGASTSYGGTSASNELPSGVITEYANIPTSPIRGLAFDYLELGIPVINIIDLRGLALSNGLPIDPVPFPPIGQDGVYYKESYPTAMILLAMFLLIIGAILLSRWHMKKNAEGTKS